MDANGIDKKTLAEIAGVGPSVVTKWSNGGCIRIQHIKKIAAYFNVSPTRLMEQHLDDDTPTMKRSEVNWELRALAAERKLENLRAAIRNFNKVVENLEGALYVSFIVKPILILGKNLMIKISLCFLVHREYHFL